MKSLARSLFVFADMASRSPELFVKSRDLSSTGD